MYRRGPLHAGTWTPGELDNTFGSVAKLQKGCSAEQGDNLALCFGLQLFGRVDIDGHTGIMTSIIAIYGRSASSCGRTRGRAGCSPNTSEPLRFRSAGSA
jgi:hypothetical protein